MNSGTRILGQLALLFSALVAAALYRGQFEVSAVFGFSAVLCFMAEALWVLGERQKSHH